MDLLGHSSEAASKYSRWKEPQVIPHGYTVELGDGVNEMTSEAI